MNNSRYFSLIGRILLSLIFIASGLGKVTNAAGTKAMMAQVGIPAVGLLFVVALLFEVLGGFSVLLGFKAKHGAIALMLFLIPTTFYFHNFWAFSGMEQQMQIANFLKNVAIFGGLGLVVAFGPGPISMDERRATKGEVR